MRIHRGGAGNSGSGAGGILFSGTVGTTGNGLVVGMTGTGAATLTGTNTYTGNTNVSAGTLRLTGAAGSLGAATVPVSAAGTFLADDTGAGNNVTRFNGTNFSGITIQAVNAGNNAIQNTFTISSNNLLTLGGSDYPLEVTYSATPGAHQPGSANARTSYYKMFPRYDDAFSSQGGARNTTLSAPSTTPMAPKNERLYASLGELLYSQARTANGPNRQQLESGKFFLTAHSRAPEVTLFGTPRIAMWPVDASTGKRTAFDKLLAFCATTGTGGGPQYPYYFQHSNSASTTADFDPNNIPRNPKLFDHLMAETSQPIPGFGGTFSGKYAGTGADGTTAEREQILTEMVDYIRSTNLEDHSNPTAQAASFAYTNGATVGQDLPLKVVRGAGSSTTTTHGLGRVNTLSEIGFHIICTADGGTGGSFTYQPPVIVPSVSTTIPVSPVVGSSENAPYASNLPVKQFLRNSANQPVGIGTSRAANGLDVPFPANPTLAIDSSPTDPGAGTELQPNQKRLQAVLIMECDCPMMGYYSIQPHYGTTIPAFQIAVSGLENFVIGNMGTKKPFPNRASTDLYTSGPVRKSNTSSGILPVTLYRFTGHNNYGGIIGFRYPMQFQVSMGTPQVTDGNTHNSWSGVTPNQTSSALPYRFVSDPFTVSTLPAAGATPGLNFGGNFTLQLQTAGGVTYQTFNVGFPAPASTTGQIPIQDMPQWGVKFGTIGVDYGAFATFPHDWWGFDNRIAWTTEFHTANCEYGDAAAWQGLLHPGGPRAAGHMEL